MSERLIRHWQSDDHRRKNKRKGFEIQEERAARAHPGGEQTRGSGSSRRPSRKGDSVGTYFRQSDKTTEKASVRLERDWWDEIDAQARATGHAAMLVIGFDATSKHPKRIDLAAFDLSVADYMTKAVAAVLEGDYAKARALAALAVGEA